MLGQTALAKQEARRDCKTKPDKNGDAKCYIVTSPKSLRRQVNCETAMCMI